MRYLLWFSLALAVGCREPGLQQAEANLVLATDSMEFGETQVGSVSEQLLVIRNEGRASLPLDVTAPASPFEVRLPNELPPGELSLLARFRPSAPGAFAAELRVNGRSISLRGVGVGCAEGRACADPCLEQATCISGRCVGVLRSCDDQNPRTVDACGPSGCVHLPADPPNDCSSSLDDCIDSCAEMVEVWRHDVPPETWFSFLQAGDSDGNTYWAECTGGCIGRSIGEPYWCKGECESCRNYALQCQLVAVDRLGRTRRQRLHDFAPRCCDDAWPQGPVHAAVLGDELYVAYGENEVEVLSRNLTGAGRTFLVAEGPELRFPGYVERFIDDAQGNAYAVWQGGSYPSYGTVWRVDEDVPWDLPRYHLPRWSSRDFIAGTASGFISNIFLEPITLLDDVDPDGDTRWSRQQSWETVFAAAGGRLFGTSQSDAVAWTLSDGAELWRVPFQQALVPWTTWVASDSTVIALEATNGGSVASALASQTGARLWTAPPQPTAFDTYLLPGGWVLLAAEQTTLIDPAGDTRISCELPLAATPAGSILHDGLLVVASSTDFGWVPNARHTIQAFRLRGVRPDPKAWSMRGSGVERNHRAR